MNIFLAFFGGLTGEVRGLGKVGGVLGLAGKVAGVGAGVGLADKVGGPGGTEGGGLSLTVGVFVLAVSLSKIAV